MQFGLATATIVHDHQRHLRTAADYHRLVDPHGRRRVRRSGLRSRAGWLLVDAGLRLAGPPAPPEPRWQE